MDSTTAKDNPNRVGCVLVNYRTPWDMLCRCLDSIITEGSSIGCSITLLDNASGDSVPARVRQEYPDVNLIEMRENAGFAAAVNRGLKDVVEPYVLMLNTDAVLAEGSLSAMVETLDSAPGSCAGVAPKMLLSSFRRGIIDAVGTVMPIDGSAFSRGVGQCDLGQYDQREEVSGVCFGAALLRRHLFEQHSVGLLCEGYFLYFEDSDWCMRAMSQGLSFLTVPDAVVDHEHSGVARMESDEFKYRLIELNTLKVVTRNFESASMAMRVVASRVSRLLARTFVRRRRIRANLHIIASYMASLPDLLAQRRRLGERRTASDSRTFTLAAGEHAWFDTIGYRPDRCLDSLIDSYGRLERMQGGDKAAEVLSLLKWIKLEQAAGHKPPLSESQRALLQAEPACVGELLESSGVAVS